MRSPKKKICIVGLGYVGLPLAVEFGKVREVIGYDLNKDRINKLKVGVDETRETTKDEIAQAKFLKFSSNPSDISEAQIFIITVPTPIDENKKPDLKPLESASKLVSKHLKKGDMVIYESTVYPGATEEFCVPLLETNSNLKFNRDFFCGYSPERINPGDKLHRLRNIKKITSGSTKKIAKEINMLYLEIIDAGTYLADNIRVAEAAKVIENTQRDINIALINELSLIFNKMNIDTNAVLEAAGTKWNFLPFRPGLVGGHCIGVDPYYLTHKSLELGYSPNVILAGRKINDSMGKHVATEVLRLVAKKKIPIENLNILIMGFTFKENCPDIRNSKVIDIYNHFIEFSCHVDVYDPEADKNDVLNEYGINLINKPGINLYDAIVVAVGHDSFKSISVDEIRTFGKLQHILYDVKSIFDCRYVDGAL